MKNWESRFLCLTRWVKTPSAAGLLQILPRQTNRTENGLLAESDEGVEAITDGLQYSCGNFNSCVLMRKDRWVLTSEGSGGKLVNAMSEAKPDHFMCFLFYFLFHLSIME